MYKALPERIASFVARFCVHPVVNMCFHKGMTIHSFHQAGSRACRATHPTHSFYKTSHSPATQLLHIAGSPLNFFRQGFCTQSTSPTITTTSYLKISNNN